MKKVQVLLLIFLSIIAFSLSVNMGVDIGGMLFETEGSSQTRAICGEYYAEIEFYHVVVGLGGFYFPQKAPSPYNLEGFTLPYPYAGVSFELQGLKPYVTFLPLIPQTLEEGALISVVSAGLRKEIADKISVNIRFMGMVNFKGFEVSLPGVYAGVGYTF